jgi:hypothetical protein
MRDIKRDQRNRVSSSSKTAQQLGGRALFDPLIAAEPPHAKRSIPMLKRLMMVLAAATLAGGLTVTGAEARGGGGHMGGGHFGGGHFGGGHVRGFGGGHIGSYGYPGYGSYGYDGCEINTPYGRRWLSYCY